LGDEKIKDKVNANQFSPKDKLGKIIETVKDKSILPDSLPFNKGTKFKNN